MDLFPDLPAWLYAPAVLALFGLCIGSFLNVVVHRLPLMMERDWRAESAELLGLPPPESGAALSLAQPRSRCPHCGHQLGWYENIPLLSWLVLRGRCSACKAPISLRYPLVELGCALLFAALAQQHGAHPVTLAWCGVGATLLALALIDWDTTYLPDSLNQPLLWAGLIAAACGWTVPLDSALWGAVIGYLSLWSVTALFKLVTGKVGMGAGDFKLLAALGAWLGGTMILPIVLAASLLGAVVGIVLKLRASLRPGGYMPFGPFLAGAGLVVMLAGAERVSGWIGWR
jgi:leader peptidase (prepilin peptidase)/N-methyltransferase